MAKNGQKDTKNYKNHPFPIVRGRKYLYNRTYNKIII